MKKNKAAGIMKLLKQGYAAREIKDRMAVSESYIYAVKKQMAADKAAAKAAAKAAKTTKLSVDSNLSFTPKEVGVSEEVFIEAALAASQGKGKERVVGTAERKVLGGPATMIRPTTEDRVNRILDERGSRYGNFLDHARITQRLKEVAHGFAAHHGKTFDVDQAEALDMIFHKIGGRTAVSKHSSNARRSISTSR